MSVQRCVLAFAVFAFILGVFSFAFSGTYERSVWKGTITMIYREAGGESMGYEVNQIDNENRWSFSNTFTVMLKACGNSLEQAYVKNASVDYTHTWKSSEVRQRQVCQPRGEVKKPGWKSTDEGRLMATVHPDFVGTNANVSLTVSLQPSGGMRYTISAGLLDRPQLLLMGSSVSKQYDPCQNSSTSTTVDYKPGVASARTNCSEDGKICHSVVPSGPVILPIVFSHTDITPGPHLKGKVTMPLEKSGDALLASIETQIDDMVKHLPPELRKQMMEEMKKTEKASAQEKQGQSDPTDHKGSTSRAIDASWDITKSNPCDDVTDQLRQELSMIQAYADPNLVSRARREGWSGEKYDDAAFEYGKSKYASEWWKGRSSGQQPGYSGNPPDGDRQRHIDMALNNEQCSIEGQDEKRKALKQNCVPQVVYDSILEHEKTHAKQCMSEHTAKEFVSRTPDSFRKFEQSAYCAGAKKLLNWADGVCKESDIKPLRDVYRTYCPR